MSEMNDDIVVGISVIDNDDEAACLQSEVNEESFEERVLNKILELIEGWIFIEALVKFFFFWVGALKLLIKIILRFIHHALGYIQILNGNSFRKGSIGFFTNGRRTGEVGKCNQQASLHDQRGDDLKNLIASIFQVFYALTAVMKFFRIILKIIFGGPGEGEVSISASDWIAENEAAADFYRTMVFYGLSAVFIIAGIHASAQPGFLYRNKKSINNNDTTFFGNIVYLSILVITVVLSHQSISSAWDMIQTIAGYISGSTLDESHISVSIIALTVVYVFSMTCHSIGCLMGHAFTSKKNIIDCEDDAEIRCKVINSSDEVKSAGLFRFELFHECVETAVNLCYEILTLVFGKKMFQGIFSVGDISSTSETKQPLKTMISMVLSGYVACICAAAIITSGILCGLFYESEIDRGMDFLLGNKIIGMFYFIGVFCATSVLCVEDHIPITALGYIFTKDFGLREGTSAVIMAAVVGKWLGSFVSYAIGNFACKAGRNSGQIPNLSEKKTLRTLVFARLAGNVSAWELNYCSGILSLAKAEFGISLLGDIPRVVLLVQLGAAFVASADGLIMSPHLFGVLVSLVLIGFGPACGYLAKYELNQVAKTSYH
mmetsp:Transcript_13015/g.14943  ORF Transcript_13015/g.14943 Transcript_13015/m.14943 type:complete len:604 (+) Transcript_13015:100-1911(+)